jgi:hypothetical protein
MAMKKGEAPEGVADHRIRITLTGREVAPLEKGELLLPVCFFQCRMRLRTTLELEQSRCL